MKGQNDPIFVGALCGTDVDLSSRMIEITVMLSFGSVGTFSSIVIEVALMLSCDSGVNFGSGTLDVASKPFGGSELNFKE